MPQQFHQEQSFIFSQTMAQRLSILQMGASKLALLVEQSARKNPLLDASKIAAPWNRPNSSVDSSLAESIEQERRLYDQVREDLILDWEESDSSLLYLILGSLDEFGFLGMDAQELCQGTLFDSERTEFLREKIMRGSIPGLAAVDAKEYYLYAAREAYGEESPAYQCALLIYQSKKKSGIPEALLKKEEPSIKAGLEKLKKLPSSPLGREARSVIPDFTISIEQGALKVQPTRSLKPGVVLEGAEQFSSKELQAFRKEAQALIEAVQAREEALLRHAEALILARSDFFMKDAAPAVVGLKEISAITGRHMSTVSRALKGRYFLFEGAITPFSALWSHRVGGIGHKVLEGRLKGILDNEDKSQPLSDGEIQKILKKQGIDLARRTVAKYREKLGIPGMHERKIK